MEPVSMEPMTSGPGCLFHTLGPTPAPSPFPARRLCSGRVGPGPPVAWLSRVLHLLPVPTESGGAGHPPHSPWALCVQCGGGWPSAADGVGVLPVHHGPCVYSEGSLAQCGICMTSF